jgi:starch phosphorylase
VRLHLDKSHLAADKDSAVTVTDLDRQTSAADTWWRSAHGGEDDFLVAYFCAEFGVDASLPVYSGGLGVLAGDHLKAAADLGVPLVAVGLLYGAGYFRQLVDESGRQIEEYPRNDPERLPLTLERTPAREPLLVHVELAGEPLAARVWRADVGGVRLYLLDSDVEGNSEAARRVTSALYGGDREQRIRQELLLGVGGVRALRALGIAPTAFHMNEGHAAFLALERLRELVEDAAVRAPEAVERVRAETIFTTHTPVPAGNEVFEPELVRRYAGGLAARAGLSEEAFLELGRAFQGDPGFGLTPLALRLSAHANGVSELHGRVTREMWAALWPEAIPADVPIGHVTNGVHAPTWLAPELAAVLRSTGIEPAAAPAAQRWERAGALDGAALWRAHAACKRRALARAPSLDPDVLTIGFARRFATYKRAGLLFSDVGRLQRLLDDPARPVQVVFAGKAHPADEAGKDVMEAIVRFARERGAAGGVVFLADYDLALARDVVAGADVWLNNPRRPQEASGTSGMKAGMNGVLNVSVLDGWWAEAYAPEIGWAISPHAELGDDGADAQDLYRLLEEEVVPLYYERDSDGIPRRWSEMMKASIAAVGGSFGAHRMVVEYVERYYLPAHRSRAGVPRTLR